MSEPRPVSELVAGAERELRSRLRAAVVRQAGIAGVTLTDRQAEELVGELAAQAPPALWQRCVAQAAAERLGVGLAAALGDPEVVAALAPAHAEPAARPPAVRLPAVHLSGVGALRAGESDVELRISDTGIDVLKRSTGAPIGRLDRREIQGVELPHPRRSLRPGGRRDPELHLIAAGGAVAFALPGLTEEQLREHLEPLLAGIAGERPPDD